jgi:pantoate--beta-alanine ligase
MIVATTIAQARAERAKLDRLALIPTMGALHVGHLSLIDFARKHASHVAVSIFVNPTQFGPREDFQKYPRPIEHDLAKCRDRGVELVFNPSVEEMYPPKPAGPPLTATPGTAKPQDVEIQVDVPALATVLEGRVRPNHFRGVCQVVAKLFNILRPDVACFGLKDFQQLRILEVMTESLDWPIKIVPCPTVREPDGLACSSRNQYLKPAERTRALVLSKALFTAQEQFNKGVKQTNRLVATIQNMLLEGGEHGRVPLLIDYVAAVDYETLRNVETVDRPTALAVAVRIGATRLIDNVVLTPA